MWLRFIQLNMGLTSLGRKLGGVFQPTGLNCSRDAVNEEEDICICLVSTIQA